MTKNDIIRIIKHVFEKNPKASIIVDEIKSLAKEISGTVKIMNFCGTHEWTISHYGLRTLMPENVELIAGPGCPVCITPGYYVDLLIELSMNGYTIHTYGDAYKLPGTRIKGIRSLYEAHAMGGKVNVVYSFLDAVKHALRDKSGKHVFFAVGFETTIPTTAYPLLAGSVPDNMFILHAYRLTPPVMRYLLENRPDIRLDGVIAPGHVSSIIGANAWSFLPRDYGVPVVVSGFEPIDVLLSIKYILEMRIKDKPSLINEYTRVVKPEGNIQAKKAIEKVYEARTAYWRAIGYIPDSGAYPRREYRDKDLVSVLGIEEKPGSREHLPGCRCPDVVLGAAKPTDCPLFLKRCTPENPYGPCMVSSEGTCRIWAENIPFLNLD
ncbi:MAG: hydrogenase formation protein HypD [Crenarchaeota archaeon]|nr:hydrogenase formation protein HypD [Thermoproteota archaeon]